MSDTNVVILPISIDYSSPAFQERPCLKVTSRYEKWHEEIDWLDSCRGAFPTALVWMSFYRPFQLWLETSVNQNFSDYIFSFNVMLLAKLGKVASLWYLSKKNPASKLITAAWLIIDRSLESQFSRFHFNAHPDQVRCPASLFVARYDSVLSDASNSKPSFGLKSPSFVGTNAFIWRRLERRGIHRIL